MSLLRPVAERRILIPMLMWLSLCGCGSTPRELGQVEGNVTFQGKPVGPAMVYFVGPAGGVSLSTPVNERGEYRVVMAEGEGLPLAEYQVAVGPPFVDIITDQPLPTPPDPADIPPPYRDPTTSGLKLEVRPGLNRFNIEMQP